MDAVKRPAMPKRRQPRRYTPRPRNFVRTPKGAMTSIADNLGIELEFDDNQPKKPEAKPTAADRS